MKMKMNNTIGGVMTSEDKFNVEQVIGMIESKLKSNPNSCEFEFLKKLKEELIVKLKEQDDE
jgi:hypothetical protein